LVTGAQSLSAAALALSAGAAAELVLCYDFGCGPPRANVGHGNAASTTPTTRTRHRTVAAFISTPPNIGLQRHQLLLLYHLLRRIGRGEFTSGRRTQFRQRMAFRSAAPQTHNRVTCTAQERAAPRSKVRA